LKIVEPLVKWIESAGAFAPWCFLLLFLVASGLLVWRLEAMSESGFEGTVLGTLIMPYCSGIGNLIFAFVLGASRDASAGKEVMTNALVNNVTNMTLLIGLPATFWGMRVMPAGNPRAKKRKSTKPQELNRLSLLLTLVAVLFFSGVIWVLTRDGKIDFTDGLILIGVFLFWQCFHVFEVLKNNVRQNKSLGWMILVNLALLGIGAFAIYVSIEWLVAWSTKQSGFIADHQGWLSGLLMVIPNALLAFYYAWRGEPEVVYSSQVGDGHICIPLCVGIYALYGTMTLPAFFNMGLFILLGATVIHFIFVALIGGLPRFMGVVLTLAYGVFVYKGLIN
jgi:cation:H+ antiporter